MVQNQRLAILNMESSLTEAFLFPESIFEVFFLWKSDGAHSQQSHLNQPKNVAKTQFVRFGCLEQQPTEKSIQYVVD